MATQTSISTTVNARRASTHRRGRARSPRALPVSEIVRNIILEVRAHMDRQTVDLTLLALKRTESLTVDAAAE